MDGIVHGCIEQGAKYLGSPVYPMISIANDLGYGVAHRGGDLVMLDPDGAGDIPPYISLPSCSATGGCILRGDEFGPVRLTSTCDADNKPPASDGALAPVGCQLDYGWLPSGRYTNYGAGLHLLNPSTCHESGGLGAEQALTYRVVFGAGGGGSFTMRIYNSWTGSSHASRRVIASSDGQWAWRAADLALPADPARQSQFLSCSWAGAQVGAADAVEGPVALGWHSIFRPDTLGVSATPLVYRGGASLGDIRNDLEQMSDGTLRRYFEMLRARQQAAGGSGRVILFIQGGVNLDSPQLQSLPELWVRHVTTMANRARQVWIASGHPPDQFGVIAMVSHPFGEHDPVLRDIRTAAAVLGASGAVEGLAVVDLSKLAAWHDYMEGNWHLNSAVDPGPDDMYHLKPEGFAAVAARAVESLSNFESCVGDINGDDAVDVADFAMLLGRWGTVDFAADLDEDGMVAGHDLSVLLARWGACP